MGTADVRILGRSRRAAEAVAAALADGGLKSLAATFEQGVADLATADLAVVVEPTERELAAIVTASSPATALLVLVSGAAPDVEAVAATEPAGPAAPTATSTMASRPVGWLPVDSDDERLVATARALLLGLDVHPAGFGAWPRPETPAGDSANAVQADAAELVEPLTARELQVFELMAKGLANRDIAAALGITHHTAKFHVGQILEKTGSATRTEAVRQGFRLGLIGL